MAIMEVAPPAPQLSGRGVPAVFELGAAEIAARVSRSVVEVRTRGGAGAGIIWRAGGVVVTNHHVLGADRASARLADGRVFGGRVVARDEYDDLAVLQLEGQDLSLPAAEIGSAVALRPGELVIAVGHPFGLRAAVSAGVVASALDREGSWGRELIRADVRLGPGNSGGPLVDSRGRVVGVNAMVSGGLGLAVPAHLAEALVVDGRQRRRAVLGIEVRDVQLPPVLAARTGVTQARADAGVLVTAVESGSAAERAGLLLGDILVGADGEALGGSPGLRRVLASYRGGLLHLGILRGGVYRIVAVALHESP